MIFTIDIDDTEYTVHVVHYSVGRPSGPPDLCYPEEIEYGVSPDASMEHEDRLHDAVMERLCSEGVRRIRNGLRYKL